MDHLGIGFSPGMTFSGTITLDTSPAHNGMVPASIASCAVSPPRPAAFGFNCHYQLTI